MRHKAFTIIELIVVILVIGIIATVVIISYSGISSRGTVASLQSDLVNSSKILENYKTSSSSDVYPDTKELAGIKSSNNATITYNYMSGSKTYCLEESISGYTYSITNNNTVTAKPCSLNGLVAWWKFNGDMNDSSGNGNNLTNNGATLTTGYGGLINTAYSFNGTSNNATASNINNMNTDFTVSLWFKGSEVSTWRWLFNLNNYGTAGSGGITFTTNAARLRWTYGIWFTEATLSAPSTIDSVNWWHAVFGRSGSTLFTYQNGSAAGTFQAATSNNISTTYSIRLGQGPNSSADWYSGSMDDVRIYNRALSTAEIAKLTADGAQ